MLSFKLSDAILVDAGGFPSKHYSYGDWFMIYEWLCRKMLESPCRKYEWLNATSSINNQSFYAISDEQGPCRKIAYLLTHGFGLWEETPNEFLRYLGVKKFSDLSKSITITGRRPTLFPDPKWFQMENRTFSYSPNSCHPKAKCVYGFNLVFCNYRKRWRAHIIYGYPNDSSSWEVSLQQGREHLNSFAQRIDAWIEDQLVYEADDRHRLYDNQVFNRAVESSKDIFFFDYWDDELYDGEYQLAEVLTNLNNAGISGNKITINKRRLNVLKRWARR